LDSHLHRRHLSLLLRLPARGDERLLHRWEPAAPAASASTASTGKVRRSEGRGQVTCEGEEEPQRRALSNGRCASRTVTPPSRSRLLAKSKGGSKTSSWNEDRSAREPRAIGAGPGGELNAARHKILPRLGSVREEEPGGRSRESWAPGGAPGGEGASRPVSSNGRKRGAAASRTPRTLQREPARREPTRCQSAALVAPPGHFLDGYDKGIGAERPQ
jgi:hypothetical protein